MSEVRLGHVLSMQTERIVRALQDEPSIDANPILTRDETLESEEYVTLCYELHHVILPELERNGLVEFDRFEDEVTRGDRFEEIRPSDERIDSDPGTLLENRRNPHRT